MIKSIFYKEWLKTRVVVLLAAALNIGCIAYILLSLRNTLLSSGVVETWATMIGRDIMMVNSLMLIPLITGIVLAVMQWLPEMQQKRIKLTLHLPIKYGYSIGLMLGYGLTCLLLTFILDAALLAIVESLWLPAELVYRTFLTTLPWYIAGCMGYAVISWLLLEPTWRIRIIDACIGAPLVGICFLTTQPACYINFIPCLIILAAIMACLPLYSVYRFKMGEGLV